MAFRTSKPRPCSTPELRLTTPSATVARCLATSLPCRVLAVWVTWASNSLTNLGITLRPLGAVPKTRFWPRAWEHTSTLTAGRGCGNRCCCRRYPSFVCDDWGASHDRNVSARKGGGSLRKNAERQGRVPRGPDNVKLAIHGVAND